MPLGLSLLYVRFPGWKYFGFLLFFLSPPWPMFLKNIYYLTIFQCSIIPSFLFLSTWSFHQFSGPFFWVFVFNFIQKLKDELKGELKGEMGEHCRKFFSYNVLFLLYYDFFLVQTVCNKNAVFPKQSKTVFSTVLKMSIQFPLMIS